MAKTTPSGTSDESADPKLHERFLTEYNPVHPRLLGYLISLVGNRHDAEDVLQRTSITLWRKFDQYEPDTNFFAWAATVAFYEARNFQRLAIHTRIRFDDDLLALIADERVADLSHQEPRRLALGQCLASLSDSNRALLEAVYIDNADIGELARQSGRAPQTFYNRLNTLRRTLARCIDERVTCQEPA